MEKVEFKRSLYCIVDKDKTFDVEYEVSEFLNSNILTVDEYDGYFEYMQSKPYINSILTRREKRHLVYDNYFLTICKKKVPIVGTNAIIGGEYGDYINYIYDRVLNVKLNESVIYSLNTVIPYLMYLMVPTKNSDIMSHVIKFFTKHMNSMAFIQPISNRNPIMIDLNNTLYNLSSDKILPPSDSGNYKVVVCEIDYHFYHGE